MRASLNERLRIIRNELQAPYRDAIDEAMEALERNEPRKPNSTEDHAWGVKRIVPVCPNCDYHLTITYFLDGKPGVSYCDHCGQCINWSEWKYDPEN